MNLDGGKILMTTVLVILTATTVVFLAFAITCVLSAAGVSLEVLGGLYV